MEQQIKIPTLILYTQSLNTATPAEAAGMFSFTLQSAYTTNHNKFWSHNRLENLG